MPGRCPGCGSTGKLVPILYGDHTPEAEERSRQGKVVLGIPTCGCGPRFECLVCGVRLR